MPTRSPLHAFPLVTPEVVLRTTAVVRLSSLAFTAATLAACARSAATTRVEPTPAVADVDSSDLRAHGIADSLRAQIIARADWSVAPDSCDPGVLRTFTMDSTSTLQARTTAGIERLEQLIVSYGLDTPLDTRAGHELLREVVAWEAGGGNLRWDAKPGEPDRHALAPGLGGRFRNPQTKRCERYVQNDAVTIALPAVTHFVPPTVTGVKVRVVAGGPALLAARTSAGAANPFSYVRVGPVVLWRDYALVTTRRVTEAGTAAGAAGAPAPDVGNATYLLHRGTDGWRLLVISRTW